MKLSREEFRQWANNYYAVNCNGTPEQKEKAAIVKHLSHMVTFPQCTPLILGYWHLRLIEWDKTHVCDNYFKNSMAKYWYGLADKGGDEHYSIDQCIWKAEAALLCRSMLTDED